MDPVIIVHHHEIVLKGDNRKFFEKQLLKNIKLALGDLLPNALISGGYGRFVIAHGPGEKTDEIVSRLKLVFGIANIGVGMKVNQDIGSFVSASERLLQDQKFSSIRVQTRRTDKRFNINSMEINRQLGAYICDRFGVKADLTSPDETIHVDIVNGVAYVYRAKIKGACGLPSGVSGKVVSLISAGFDSPVASWQLMKRGATVIFVHFHSMPYTSQHSVGQVRELVRILTRYQYQSKLYIVPFAEIQQEIVLHAPQPLRVILYRRMMIRIAEEIARKESAEALVTGEAVGQVASQTLRNIRNIDSAAQLPILRPLCGTDKEETMAIARIIGTYEISKEPYDDCCSFLAPRRPETWSDQGQIGEAENKLDLDAMAVSGLEKRVLEKFYYPSGPAGGQENIEIPLIV